MANKKPFTLKPSQWSLMATALEYAQGRIYCLPRDKRQKSVFVYGSSADSEVAITRAFFWQLRDAGYVEQIKDTDDNGAQVWRVTAAGKAAVVNPEG